MDMSPKFKTALLALTFAGFTASPAVLAGEGYEHNKDKAQTTQQQGATAQQRDRDSQDQGMGAAGTDGTMGGGTDAGQNSEWQDRDNADQPYTEPGEPVENVDLDTAEDQY